MNRNEVTRTIKAALKRRSGIDYSVKGGTGTAWGWIRIDATPSRIAQGHWDADLIRLAELLNETSRYPTSVSIPASSDYWQEYIDRAEGRTPTVRGHQYWD